MTKRQKFINMIQAEIFDNPTIYSENYPDDFEDILEYWNAFKGIEEKEKPAFTDNGKLILQYMQNNPAPMWKARDIAEGLFMTSRVVSGAMNKLVNDGYVEKMGQNPVIYSITNKGKNIVFEDNNENN